MDPSLIQTPLNVKSLLSRYGIKPSKGLGQNFLSDNAALDKVVLAAGDLTGKTVLEVGPGLGSLTRLLCHNAGRVVAVELDKKLIPVLQEILEPFKNVEIIQGDILEIDPAEVISEPGYYVIANIPYNITSALIRHLLEATSKPVKIVLTIQQEVAERICEKPGHLSLLALSVQVYGSPKIAARIPAEAFYPVPGVDSAVVCVDLYPAPLIPPEKLNRFFALIKAGFSQKRKTLRNSLSAGLNLPKDAVENLLSESEIDPMRRAETLAIDEWKLLTENYFLRSG